MTFLIFQIIGTPIVFYAFIRSQVFLRVGEDRDKVFSFWSAIGFVFLMIGAVLAHSFLAYMDAAILAFHIYRWWNNGGGDGMKTRIKNLASKFVPNPPLEVA